MDHLSKTMCCLKAQECSQLNHVSTEQPFPLIKAPLAKQARPETKNCSEEG